MYIRNGRIGKSKGVPIQELAFCGFIERKTKSSQLGVGLFLEPGELDESRQKNENTKNLMGKHSLKRKIWEKIDSQARDGYLPSWVGWVFIGGIVIWWLVSLL